MSMSLDGFVAGPDDGLDEVHNWMYPRHGTVSDSSAEVIDELFTNSGAVVMGRRTWELGDRLNDWVVNPPFEVPIFVLAHDVPERVTKAGPGLTFVTDGVEGAIKQAKAAAGTRNVTVNGGANVAQQCLQAGLLDEILLHLVPVLLGAGIRLFDPPVTGRADLETTAVVDSPGVTHFRFRVVK
jgi:dihydrofolate reductase